LRRIQFFGGLLIALTVLTSCEKEEPLYPQPKVATGIQTQIFEMGETYENQLFFDFESQQTYTSKFGLWDIGVACQGEPHFIICSGKNSEFTAAMIEDVSFENLHTIDLNTLDWEFDHPSGNKDSLAFNGCFVKTSNGYSGLLNRSYILNLGDKDLLDQQYIKIKPISAVGGVYEFLWGYLADSSSTYLTRIFTKPVQNYAYYSFINKNLINNEPVENDKWDITFTTYKEIIPDVDGTIYPYIIRGVLSNSNKVKVTQINNGTSFDEMSISIAGGLNYDDNLDVIGYDWKEYSQSAGKYTIVPNQYYVIKTTNNNYFKMRFVDFYDDQGRKGYPKMAWELMK